jgi:MFS family permease
MPLKELLKCPGVMVSIVNYGLLAILDIAYAALNPLVLASPVVLGGLGLDPPTIGLVMGAWGILNGAFQGLFFTRVLERFGPRRTFVGGIMHFVPIFVCFGLSNAVARLTRFGEEDARPGAWLVWAVVILQMVMVTFMDVSFGRSFSRSSSLRFP